MSKLITGIVGVVFAALLAVGLAAPAAHGDVTIRGAKTSDLYMRSATPSKAEVKRSYAAFMNPSLPIGPKLEVSVNGAANRGELQRMLGLSRQYDFFSMKGDVVSVNVSGNTMTARFHGTMAGFPAQGFTYSYVREGGLWKYDWKRNAQTNGMPAKFV
ncbi:hypothetical protein GOARA_063_00780 [Gordonia araii NBRC 100433]|uniref:Low molecular weight antigen MTB12-like C-terminal domain-containing protein n=1 Tax=Gordonia araii NBRC 100433 TaxID=1073574 RepID=G7H4V4_9ACTN|nr:hypothetical protein [Gordonia araii]NNG97981.1 hypothetical protein [Gordonia araii NBRC 100433]GAB10879.1 hypothetical protein GOARA_063_00780 [Gordonia araii NBRC 100433]